jgi:hypothetical protein
VSEAPGFLDNLPPWAAELVRSIRAKRANTFVIHGVPADLVPLRCSAGFRFLSLEEFLVSQLFAGWPSMVTYNRAEGLGFATPAARSHFEERMRSYDAVHGTTWADRLPRDATLGQARHGGDMRLAVFHYPLQGWTDAVAMNVLQGLATGVTLAELGRVSYAPLAEVFRALRAAAADEALAGEPDSSAAAGGAVGGEALAAILRGAGGQPRSGAVAGRLLRVLSELGLVALTAEPLTIIVPAPAGRTVLERSHAFRAYSERLCAGLEFLAEPRRGRQPDRAAAPAASAA